MRRRPPSLLDRPLDRPLDPRSPARGRRAARRRSIALATLLPLACAGAPDPGEDESAGTTEGSATDTSGEASTTDESATDTDATDTAETTGEPGPPPLEPLDHAPWTTDERVQITTVPAGQVMDPRIPGDLDQLLADGYGDYTLVAGEPVLDYTLDLAPAPTPGPSPALWSRFVHLADVQLADDESPTRFALLDDTAALNSAFRPQEAHVCQILNAAVRTINAIAAERDLDFVLLGGDNIDSAQANELEWFVSILDGEVVHCDSGIDDDPVPGPSNDPKDPFTPVGLDVPWFWVNGNHDVLLQGNLPIAGHKGEAIGSEALTGTRDWSQPGGPVISGTIAPDDRRALVSVAEIMARVAASRDGHAIDDAVKARERLLYAVTVGDTPLEIVQVDSAAATGGSGGVIHQADLDAWVGPALDAAEAAGHAVIVTSHHCSTSLGDGGGFGGTTQADAVPTAEWQAFLGEHPSVIMHLCAHSHTHRVRVIEPMGGHAYWEVATASLADEPQEFRVIEIHDQDNGFLTITGVAIDYAVADDPLASDGRARSITDYTSGWNGIGDGTVSDRNVRLWIPWP
ncbi:MAG: metallophosphoesterase [Nannocystaceae bacterium]